MRESSLYSHTSTNTIAECVRERENSAFEVYGRRNDTSTRLLFFSLLLPRCGHDTCCAFFLNSFITLFRAGALVWEFRFPGAVQKWPVLKCSSHIRLPFWAVTPSYRLAKLCNRPLLLVTTTEESSFVGDIRKCPDACFLFWCFFQKIGVNGCRSFFLSC